MRRLTLALLAGALAVGIVAAPAAAKQPDMSGSNIVDTAVAAMKAGAHDYVMKDNLSRLGPAVERELREAKVRRERRQADEKLKAEFTFRQAIENSVPSGITAVDLEGKQTYVNPAFCALFDLPQTEIVGKTDQQLLGVEPASKIESVERRVLAGETVVDDLTDYPGGVPSRALRRGRRSRRRESQAPRVRAAPRQKARSRPRRAPCAPSAASSPRADSSPVRSP